MKIRAMKSIGSKILRTRTEQGLSKAYMSRSCGLTQTAYANIEDEKTKSISIETGKKIAKALNIGFTELFEIEIPTQAIDQNKKEIEQLKKRIEELEDINRTKSRLINIYESQMTPEDLNWQRDVMFKLWD